MTLYETENSAAIFVRDGKNIFIANTEVDVIILTSTSVLAMNMK